MLALQAIVLYLFGQPALCECGYVRVWMGEVLSSENSQHITDWYTFSHLIHGFIFYALAWRFFPQLSRAAWLFLALFLEVGWEIAENTPWLIDLYRQQALAQGYTGDSIINSVIDTLAMVTGFMLASRFSWIILLTLAVALEIYVGFMIRDNLTLNILNFFHHFEFIEEWQQGAMLGPNVVRGFYL